jgi:NAD(P)-dependent dehydrogenase (short-subunit alcohol dehydrogenase family)
MQTRLAERIFSFADQERFAAASGDRNPMHMDALKARRTQAGAPVVHGIHLLLWALNSLGAAQPGASAVRSIRVQFNKFVYLDEPVDLVLTQQDTKRARLNIAVGDAVRAKVTLDFGEVGGDVPELANGSFEPVAALGEPADHGFESMAGRSGQFPFAMTGEDAAAMFPAACSVLGGGPEGASRVAALAATTYLVGMVSPGLHSIYSELSLRTCAWTAGPQSLAFRVTDTDARFRSVDQEIAGGGLTGAVSAFVRTPPVEQTRMASLAGLVKPDEFAGSTTLIVGGSRGLGELTAKLIAAGGGRVIVTWNMGKTDAERVATEIRSAGGSCETVAYDARMPAAEQLAVLAEAPTHAYYFATPAIFRPESGFFVKERFDEFLNIYVDGFWQLAKALRNRQPHVSLFYPSSVAVTERPRGMTEYTMAKAAGEVLCADINEALAPTHVVTVRLPRLPTDQTVTVTAVEAADPIATMLPIVREVQAWPKP